MAELREAFYSLPPVTRTWLAASFLTATGKALGYISSSTTVLAWDLILKKFQIWRLGTSFIDFGDFSLSFAINLYFLVQYSKSLEKDPYPSGGGTATGNSADYLFMLIFGGLIISLFGIFFPYQTWSNPLLTMVIYVWSKRNPTLRVSFFGVQFTSVYLPWVLVGFHIITGAAHMVFFDLVGIVAGHAYYFLQEVLPRSAGSFHGRQILVTPRFLTDMFLAPAQPQPVRNAWGTGHRLD